MAKVKETTIDKTVKPVEPMLPTWEAGTSVPAATPVKFDIINRLDTPIVGLLLLVVVLLGCVLYKKHVQ